MGRHAPAATDSSTLPALGSPRRFSLLEETLSQEYGPASVTTTCTSIYTKRVANGHQETHQNQVLQARRYTVHPRSTQSFAPTSSFAQPSHPGGERFAENAHQKDMLPCLHQATTQHLRALGSRSLILRGRHGAFSFATPADYHRAYATGSKRSRHNRHKRLHKRLRSTSSTFDILSGMIKGRVGRRELTRGMASLGCFLSEADIDTLFEIYDVRYGSVNSTRSKRELTSLSLEGVDDDTLLELAQR